jgi:sporulation protein YlmC with PRC-barrel domain
VKSVFINLKKLRGINASPLRIDCNNDWFENPVYGHGGEMMRPLVCVFLALVAVMEPNGIAAFGQAMDIEILDTKGYRVSKLLGNPVFNEQDERIGKVDDIIMTREGSVILAAQVGPFVGVPSKIVLFPFIALNIDERNSRIIARDASKDRLKRMAAFVYP